MILLIDLDTKELEEVNIENLSSLQNLHLQSSSVEQITLKSLNALENLTLHITKLKTNLQTDLYDQMPNIGVLTIRCDLLNFYFHKLNKKLNIENLCNEGFFFDHICNLRHWNIEKLSIKRCSYKHISKFFSVCENFRDLLELNVYYCKIIKIEKKMFDGISMLRSLKINGDFEFQIIDHDAFSNLKQLVYLDLSSNVIDSLDKRTFSELVNLETLDLSSMRVKSLDENIFSNLKNLRQLDLESNELKFLNPRLFFGLENLYELNLSRNKLSHFDLRILDNLSGLENINLSRNLINKDKKSEIVNRFRENGIEFSFNIF